MMKQFLKLFLCAMLLVVPVKAAEETKQPPFPIEQENPQQKTPPAREDMPVLPDSLPPEIQPFPEWQEKSKDPTQSSDLAYSNETEENISDLQEGNRPPFGGDFMPPDRQGRAPFGEPEVQEQPSALEIWFTPILSLLLLALAFLFVIFYRRKRY